MATRDELDARYNLETESFYVSNLEQRPDPIMDQFEEVPVRTTSVEVKIQGEQLSLVQTTERGSPSVPKADGPKPVIRSFRIPHIETADLVKADEYQDVKAFGIGVGDTNAPEPFETAVRRREDELVADVNLTKTNMALGAFMGVVRDADGTIIYDYFQEFGIAPNPVIQLDLASEEGNVRLESMGLKRRMSRNLKLGPNVQFNILALAGDKVFDKLLTSKEVMKAFERYQENAFARGNPVGMEFAYAGILWRNFMGTQDGDTEEGFGVGIKSDEVRFAPIGLPNLYKVFYAPADYAATVNTPGLPFYAVPEAYPLGAVERKGTTVTVQSNPLFMPVRPKTLERGKLK